MLGARTARLLTNYPLGVFKVIPFVVHSAGDYLGAAALTAAPFVLGFAGSDGGLAAFYVARGGTLVAVSLITDYSDPDPPAVPRADLPTETRSLPGRRSSKGLPSSCPIRDFLRGR